VGHGEDSGVIGRSAAYDHYVATSVGKVAYGQIGLSVIPIAVETDSRPSSQWSGLSGPTIAAECRNGWPCRPERTAVVAARYQQITPQEPYFCGPGSKARHRSRGRNCAENWQQDQIAVAAPVQVAPVQVAQSKPLSPNRARCRPASGRVNPDRFSRHSPSRPREIPPTDSQTAASGNDCAISWCDPRRRAQRMIARGSEADSKPPTMSKRCENPKIRCLNHRNADQIGSTK
jgi:hypothetical protein